MSIVMAEATKHWAGAAEVGAGAGDHPGQDGGRGASGQFDLPPSEIERWVKDGERRMENAR